MTIVSSELCYDIALPLLQAGYKLVSGHVGGVSCVRFTANDAHVVSIGKGDRAVFIWKVDEDILGHA